MGRDRFGLWAEFVVEGKDGPVRQRMRWIPPGRFLMGSPEDEPGWYDNEGPQHWVNISKGFWLFDTLVTQALWQAMMGENPSIFKSPNRPVETVSWDDCQKFVQKINQQIPSLNLSLPSEAQWEYACRAGSTTALYTEPIKPDDNVPPALAFIAWYIENSDGKTQPVAQKQPNDLGLYDMLGNAWEWIADFWHGNYDGAPEDGSIWENDESKGDSVVIRGGSWGNEGRFCRSAYRSKLVPVRRDVAVGFRCARVQTENEQVLF
ncbi:MAG: formylglycine-generating enzyme family protein [Candidatus Electrothrix sp. ATG2]|nr:formylglycine-generating enzyme family protein [Candidatus Electrothrix sp. ATG2]